MREITAFVTLQQDMKYTLSRTKIKDKRQFCIPFSPGDEIAKAVLNNFAIFTRKYPC